MPPYFRSHPCSSAALAVLLAFSTSCSRDEEIRSYEVILPPPSTATGQTPAQSGGTGSAAAGAAAAAGKPSASSAVRWVAPEGWTAQPLTDMINRGHYLLPETAGSRPVLTISAYAGPAGGLVPNVNRWRRQLGLAELDAEAMTKEITPVTAGGAVIQTCRFDGTKPDGTSGAVAAGVLSLPGETWFFKLTGTKEAVAAAAPSWDAFLAGLQVAGASPGAGTAIPAAGTPAATAPAQPTSEKGPSVALAPPDGPKPVYEVPTGWKEMPPGTMRSASFSVPGPDNHNADISLLKLSGGTDLQNVNLWRGQLGLAAATEAEMDQQLPMVKAGTRDVRIFDASGAEKSLGGAFRQRIIAAIFTENGAVWVARLRGEHHHLDQEKENFLAFLASVRFP